MLHQTLKRWPGGLWPGWLVLLLASLAVGRAGQVAPAAVPAVERLGIAGGLCVQLGCDQVEWACRLARSGRFLVEVLDDDDGKIAETRRSLQTQGLYGLVSVDRWNPGAGLPFAENLVDLLVVTGGRTAEIAPAEMVRVIRPGGVIVFQDGHFSKASLEAAGLERVQAVAADGWIAARKRWPAAMDDWPQPRHAADGNAVSGDALVGPPRRVRWVAGPSREVARLVSCEGRNYYGDVWARDAFNGLLLWRRELNSPASGNGSGFAYLPGTPAPIAAGDLLFVLSRGTVAALDGVTGDVVRRYPEAGRPSELLETAGLLVTVDGQSVRGLDIDTARLRWKYETSQPRYVVASQNAVFLMEGALQRGEPSVAVCLDLAGGQVRWKRDDYPWAPQVRRAVCRDDVVAFEVSTLADDEEGNAVHVVSASDGKLLWSRVFVPGMNHKKQARVMFIGDSLWVLERSQGVRLDPRTGQQKGICPAGFCHCFPPVATGRFLLAGEMELTDLDTGTIDANRITKAACGRDFGWVPANGLIYVTPKHCVCWPMLRGFAALAPDLPAGAETRGEVKPDDFAPERGPAYGKTSPPPSAVPVPPSQQWPMYRHDAWRSASTTAEVPAEVGVLWTADLGGWPGGAIADDWRENPFVHGPVTPPVIAGGAVFVARPDAHQVVALDTQTGRVRWQFTANGRVDTAPTIHQGLCLFGTRSGWVYCLRASDGQLAWRLRAAPASQQIVAYGQVESPWPVPGSVLVVDGVAYFAAGRQPLADGGIRVFAAEPDTGQVRWGTRLDTVPTENFYGSSGLEFDNFDLLNREGDRVAMSRWTFALGTGRMRCEAAEAFARLRTDAGSAGVIVPRGCWTYAPRHQPRADKTRPPERPLVVFRKNTLVGCLQDQRTVYRRDFDAESLKQFDTTWITGWAAAKSFRDGIGEVWRSDRLASRTSWSVPVFGDGKPEQRVAAMVLAGDALFLASRGGELVSMSATDGRVFARTEVPAVVWDGMAAAAGRLFVSTLGGQVVCLGSP